MNLPKDIYLKILRDAAKRHGMARTLVLVEKRIYVDMFFMNLAWREAKEEVSREFMRITQSWGTLQPFNVGVNTMYYDHVRGVLRPWDERLNDFRWLDYRVQWNYMELGDYGMSIWFSKSLEWAFRTQFFNHVIFDTDRKCVVLGLKKPYKRKR